MSVRYIYSQRNNSRYAIEIDECKNVTKVKTPCLKFKLRNYF